MNLRSVVNFVIVCIMFSGLLCSDWENPYLNKSKSCADVLNKSFSDKDTVEIFSRESLSVVVYLKDHVSAFKVSIEKNRFWTTTDSLIIADKFSKEPFMFTFSFYDTGWHTVILSTIYNDNTKKDIKYKLYAKSPLSQNRIEADMGSSVLLKTNPVKDDNVMYIWDFNNGQLVKSEIPSVEIKIDASFTNTDGSLYVEDLNQQFKSPSFIFPVLINKEMLEIKCENSSIFRDTIYAQTETFTLDLKVNGAKELLNSKINNQDFDEKIRNDDSSFSLRKTFNNLDTLVEPLEIHVFCEDDEKRTIDSYFYLKYTGIQSQIVVQYPEEDSVNVGESKLLIYGTVSDYSSLDTVTLVVKNKGKTQDYMILSGENEWQFILNLDEGWNNLVLELYEDSAGKGTPFARTEKHIKYSLGLTDTTSPQIVSVKSNGIELFDGFVSRTEILPVELLVIDDRKTDSVTVNGSECNAADNGINFNIDVNINHNLNGDSLIIKAVDSSGNSCDTVITIFFNRMPKFDLIPLSQTLLTDSIFKGEIEVSDEDNDSLEITVTIKKGENETVMAVENKTFEWIPDSTDTGWHEIIIEANDGYETADTSFTLLVLESEKEPVPVKWLTNENNFPQELLIGTDTLKVNMEVHSLTGTPPYNFTVYCGNDQIHKSDEKNLEWVPTSEYAGKQMLLFIVEDSLGYTDTFNVSITVIKPPAAYVNWEKTSLSFDEGGEEWFINAVMTKPLNDTVKIPFSVDWSGSHAGTSDFTFENDTILIFEPGDTLASTLVKINDDKIAESNEQFVLFLRGSDSIHTGQRYVFTGTIVDNDNITFSFEQDASSGSEGDERVSIPVVLSEPVSDTVVLYCELEDKSTADFNDFSMPDSILIEPGEISKDLRLSIVDDTIPENDETIVLRLKSKENNLIKGEFTSHNYTIISNEREIGFTVDTLIINEWVESSTQVWIEISEPINSFESIRAYFEVDSLSTASIGQDYTIKEDDHVSFYTGDKSKTIGLAAKVDNIIEGNETVIIRIKSLSDYSRGYIGKDKCVVIIEDIDTQFYHNF